MNSINWPASSIWVFIAQLGEHCSANAEATGSNPVEAPKKLFSGYFRNCLNCDSLRWSHTHFIWIPAVHIISFSGLNFTPKSFPLDIFSRTQINEISSWAIHLNGPYGKIRTAQGTNQNAPFHHGPVQPYDNFGCSYNPPTSCILIFLNQYKDIAKSMHT